MEIEENRRYEELLNRLRGAFPHWGMLRGKTMLVSGASGMIGSVLVDAVMEQNLELGLEDCCKIVVVGRSRQAAERRLRRWLDHPAFRFVEQDVGTPLDGITQRIDYAIHAASTTHPLAYAREPIDTIMTNVLGTRNMLELAAGNPGSRFLLLSSVEVYGQNRGDAERFSESYCGYLDCNTLRAGYPEGKRVSEALCQAYIAQRGVDAVTIRLPRCYGPTMRMEDSKAIAQFIKNGVLGEDIVLKSDGSQLYSFAHVSDAVLGLLWVLLQGETGQAYNLGGEGSDITQRALAELIADHVGTKVVFRLPEAVERSGYSTATKALMDAGKLRALGWSAHYDIAGGIRETIDILRDLQE